MELTVRPIRESDVDPIVAFTQETWDDHGVDDHIPWVIERWVEAESDTRRTFVVDAGADIAGLTQGVMLSDHEAWGQGMRVNPAFRGQGIARRLSEAFFDWAAERGATVARNMVYSWNMGGLGQSRAVGFEPATEFRFVKPEPDADATPTMTVTHDAEAAWSYWNRSAARTHLAGLSLDFNESWALSELTLDKLRTLEEDAVFAVQDEGTVAMAYRNRTYEHTNDDGETHTYAEYGVGAWDDVDAARSLFAALSADAAAQGVDRTRVLVPETVRYVSDAAAARVQIHKEPDFVLEADLTTRH
ncbi:GNAT family N-acetyltransferase [Haladaptatus sp. DYSN1]|uniref:GNAT family N-acetyltransferase n=1 Tax=unclassified Haladaptatus TaxID=2622732 RepID=UPI002404B80D|nr:GNAT family N-acetyltransferase [Haladaptatus sp. DYSN1]